MLSPELLNSTYILIKHKIIKNMEEIAKKAARIIAREKNSNNTVNASTILKHLEKSLNPSLQPKIAEIIAEKPQFIDFLYIILDKYSPDIQIYHSPPTKKKKKYSSELEEIIFISNYSEWKESIESKLLNPLESQEDLKDRIILRMEEGRLKMHLYDSYLVNLGNNRESNIPRYYELIRESGEQGLSYQELTAQHNKYSSSGIIQKGRQLSALKMANISKKLLENKGHTQTYMPLHAHEKRVVLFKYVVKERLHRVFGWGTPGASGAMGTTSGSECNRLTTNIRRLECRRASNNNILEELFIHTQNTPIESISHGIARGDKSENSSSYSEDIADYIPDTPNINIREREINPRNTLTKSLIPPRLAIRTANDIIEHTRHLTLREAIYFLLSSEIALEKNGLTTMELTLLLAGRGGHGGIGVKKEAKNMARLLDEIRKNYTNLVCIADGDGKIRFNRYILLKQDEDFLPSLTTISDGTSKQNNVNKSLKPTIKEEFKDPEKQLPFAIIKYENYLKELQSGENSLILNNISSLPILNKDCYQEISTQFSELLSKYGVTEAEKKEQEKNSNIYPKIVSKCHILHLILGDSKGRESKKRGRDVPLESFRRYISVLNLIWIKEVISFIDLTNTLNQDSQISGVKVDKKTIKRIVENLKRGHLVKEHAFKVTLSVAVAGGESADISKVMLSHPGVSDLDPRIESDPAIANPTLKRKLPIPATIPLSSISRCRKGRSTSSASIRMNNSNRGEGEETGGIIDNLEHIRRVANLDRGTQGQGANGLEFSENTQSEIQIPIDQIKVRMSSSSFQSISSINRDIVVDLSECELTPQKRRHICAQRIAIFIRASVLKEFHYVIDRFKKEARHSQLKEVFNTMLQPNNNGNLATKIMNIMDEEENKIGRENIIINLPLKRGICETASTEELNNQDIFKMLFYKIKKKKYESSTSPVFHTDDELRILKEKIDKLRELLLRNGKVGLAEAMKEVRDIEFVHIFFNLLHSSGEIRLEKNSFKEYFPHSLFVGEGHRGNDLMQMLKSGKGELFTGGLSTEHFFTSNYAEHIFIVPTNLFYAKYAIINKG